MGLKDNIMDDIECNALSAEGIKSYDYVRWKEETLANQTSHKESQQRTGLWQKFNDVEITTKDNNTFRIELDPGVRMVKTGGIEATWSCPSYASKILKSMQGVQKRCEG